MLKTVRGNVTFSVGVELLGNECEPILLFVRTNNGDNDTVLIEMAEATASEVGKMLVDTVEKLRKFREANRK